MGKFASTWPRSRGSTPTAPRRCGTIVRATPAERSPTAGSEVKTESESEDDFAIWEVKDNGDKCGLVVYERKGTLVAGRLRAGARLQEMAVDGDFFSYRKLFGEGPSVGWVRMQLDGVHYIEKLGREPEDDDNSPAKISPTAPEPPPDAQAGLPEGADEDLLAGARVWIVAIGGRGEVQPSIALGAQLRKAGCAVRVFGPAEFRSLAEWCKLPFHAVGRGMDSFWQGTEELWTSRFVEVYRYWVELEMCSTAKAVLSEMEAGPPDLLIVNSFCLAPAAVARRAYGIPAMLLVTRMDPFPTELKFTWPNYADFSTVEHSCMEGSAVAALRQLTSFREWCTLLDSLPRLVAVTPLAVAGLREEQHKEAAKTIEFLGNLVIEDQRPLGDPVIFGSSNEMKRIQAFMAKGSSTPVYIGYGSAVCDRGAQHMVLLAGMAIALVGMRAIIATGRRGMSAELFHEGLESIQHMLGPGDIAFFVEHMRKNVIFVDSAPHEWLFKRCSCTVHHGGAGTTAAALRGGMPMVITPIKEHHFFSARWINELGVGIGFDTPIDDITAEMLGWALQAATQETKIRAKAREIGRTLRKEDGGGTAVAAVRAALRSAPPSASSMDREMQPPSGAAAAGAEPRTEDEGATTTPEAKEASAMAALHPATVWVLDVQSIHEPSLMALAVGLQRAGFGVRLLGSTGQEEQAAHFGLDFVEVCAGLEEFQRQPSALERISSEDSHTKDNCLWEWLSTDLCNATGVMLGLLEEGAPDLLVLDRMFAGIGVLARRKFDVPSLLANTLAPYDHGIRVPLPYDRLPLMTADSTQSSPSAEEWAQVASAPRTLVCMPPLFRSAFPPEHRDFNEDLPVAAVTGFWLLEQPISKDAECLLETFLADGRPAVLVHLGESICHDRGWMVYVLLSAVRFAGLRALVVEGSAQLDLDLVRRFSRKHGDPLQITGYVEANTFFVKACPPMRFLKRCMCAVHNSTHYMLGATLHAGLPSVVLPFVGGHFLWGQFVQDLGVGRNLGDLRNLGHEVLAYALREVASNETIRARAASLAELIGEDDGVAAAVAFIRKELEARSGVG